MDPIFFLFSFTLTQRLSKLDIKACGKILHLAYSLNSLAYSLLIVLSLASPRAGYIQCPAYSQLAPAHSQICPEKYITMLTVLILNSQL